VNHRLLFRAIRIRAPILLATKKRKLEIKRATSATFLHTNFDTKPTTVPDDTRVPSASGLDR
jgi:hypothetical protein